MKKRFVLNIPAAISILVEAEHDIEALAAGEQFVSQYLDSPFVFRVPDVGRTAEVWITKDSPEISVRVAPSDDEWHRYHPSIWPDAYGRIEVCSRSDPAERDQIGGDNS